MHSLQTESTGLLAALCFLYCYITFNNVSLHYDTIVHYCNNSIFVGCMVQLHHQPTPTAMQYNLPDWNVQTSVTHTMKQLKLFILTKHIYGHQNTRSHPNSMTNKIPPSSKQ
eukprot:3077053-Ditylum_brightwellii.AAC.1